VAFKLGGRKAALFHIDLFHIDLPDRAWPLGPIDRDRQPRRIFITPC